MKTIVFFGDSLFGRLGKDRMKFIEDQLPGYSAYSIAAGGWNSQDGKEKAPFISKLEADYIIISLGLNDLFSSKKTPTRQFEENITRTIKSFSSSEVLYLLPPQVDAGNKFHDDKILPSDVRNCEKTLKQICNKNNVGLIDSESIFSGFDYHIEDGVHLNDFAYNKLTEEIVRIIKNHEGLTD